MTRRSPTPTALKLLAMRVELETANMVTQTSPVRACYDCGSTIRNHHTPLCEMAPKNAIKDLPQIPGTQWWTKEVPDTQAK